MKLRRQSARFKTGFAKLAALACLLRLGVVPCGAEPAPLPANPAPEEAAWRVTIAAKTALPQVTQPIPGAKETVFAAVAVSADKNGVPRILPLPKAALAALGLDWAAFSSKTAAAASAALAKLQPEWIRDDHRVIECAILRCEHPEEDISIALLAPDFLKRFKPVFGRKILIAIPERNTAYLFPSLASRYPDYAGRILSLYRKSAHPVSRELYELSATGLRAVGIYEEP